MKTTWMTLLLASGLSGCTVFSGGGPFDGTWLITIDMAYTIQGDCADPDAGTDTSPYTGEDSSLVDMYSGPDKEIVVLMGELLDGTYDRTSFEADWEWAWQSTDGESRELEQTTMDGELDGKLLSGEITSTSYESDGEDEWICQYSYDYTAEKVLSDRDDYVEN